MTMLRRAGRNASASSGGTAASVTPEDQVIGRRRPPAVPQSATRDDGPRCARIDRLRRRDAAPHKHEN